MHRPFVSIIMNCYNSSEYLKEAIDSVLEQTYTNWEIIFWDNQSTDNSANIFRQYKDKRLKYFSAREHTTLGKARNLAVAQTKGEWIAFLDCDDLWMPSKLEDQITMTKNTSVGVVYSPFEIITNIKNIQSESYYKSLYYHGHEAKNIYKQLLFRNFIIFSSVLIRKELFFTLGGINENLHQNEDYDLLIKASVLTFFVCTQYCNVKYRIHMMNTSYSNEGMSFAENRIIYKNLPQSIELQQAKKRNELRYSFFLLRKRNKSFYEGIKVFIKNFSVPILLVLLKHKLVIWIKSKI